VKAATRVGGSGRCWPAWVSKVTQRCDPGSEVPRNLPAAPPARRTASHRALVLASCSSSLARGPGATAGPIPALTSWFAAARESPACPGWSNGACRCYTRGSLRPPRGIPPSRSAQPPSRLACARPGRQFSGARAALTGGSEARSGSAHGDRATDRVGQGHTGGHSPRRRQLHRPPHASDPQMLRLRTREIVPIELRKWSWRVHVRRQGPTSSAIRARCGRISSATCRIHRTTGSDPRFAASER